jgi:hypothetical protein
MNIPFKLGDTVIHGLVHQSPGASLTMVNLHDDEDTSVAAGLAHFKRHGGRLIELVHSGERLVTFGLDGDRYSFDPNRIFSDNGIAGTFKKRSKWSADAHAEIKRFAASYLAQFALDREPVIVALHNTVDGDFSVHSFLPGAELGSNAAAVHVSPRRSRFDFCYVSERQFYDYFKARDFNVILQDNERVDDDGSLSVYCSRKGIPYINVEAEMCHLVNQIEMLEVVREMLEQPGTAPNNL